MTPTITQIRIKRSRQFKQVSPNGLPIRYCGRPGKFGNWFKVGQFSKTSILDKDNLQKYHFKVLTEEDCIYLFEKYQLPTMNLLELKGHNLSCWCSLKSKCHVDSILQKIKHTK